MRANDLKLRAFWGSERSMARGEKGAVLGRWDRGYAYFLTLGLLGAAGEGTFPFKGRLFRRTTLARLTIMNSNL